MDRRFVSGCLLLALAVLPPAVAETSTTVLPPAEIMRRVATNQDRAQTERSAFIYDQQIRVVSRYKNNKVVCEQETNYTVVPREKSAEHTLVSTQGRYWHDKHYRPFHEDPKDQDETLDTGLVKSFRDDLTHDKSRDGLAGDLFPLTTKEQENLEFEGAGERLANGRPAYVIRFRPKDSGDIAWAGEALVDREEFEPITVYTQLSRKLPFFVRTMLGTDVPGLGFTVQYTRVAKDIWFPSSFGSEFKIHAVYFFHRTVSVALKNQNFRKAQVESTVAFSDTQ